MMRTYDEYTRTLLQTILLEAQREVVRQQMEEEGETLASLDLPSVDSLITEDARVRLLDVAAALVNNDTVTTALGRWAYDTW